MTDSETQLMERLIEENGKLRGELEVARAALLRTAVPAEKRPGPRRLSPRNVGWPYYGKRQSEEVWITIPDPRSQPLPTRVFTRPNALGYGGNGPPPLGR